jgi:cyclophilin family peptidyl-prolyl cis-trans isomerase
MDKFFSLLVTIILLSSCAKPIAYFTHNKDKNIAPSKVEFNNQSKNSTTYNWDFGDGGKSTDANPVHVFKQSGNYTIILKACKEKKCAMKSENIHVDPPRQCFVFLETNLGDMEIELSNETPEHRDNFIKLVEDGYYNDLLFHRVINGFMIQGGDPNSKNAGPNTQLGSGGPGYQIKAEFVDTLVHVKGALCAARTGDQMNPTKMSSGSQFYIVQGRPLADVQLDIIEGQKNIKYTPFARNMYKEFGGTPFLDKEYTVFGRVIKGLDIIDKIAALSTENDRPLKDVKIKMTIVK